MCLDFSSNSIKWGHLMADMKPIDDLVENHFSIQDPPKIQSETERIKKILDAKYEKANLKELVKGENHLFKEEQISLYKLLKNTKLFLMVL